MKNWFNKADALEVTHKGAPVLSHPNVISDQESEWEEEKQESSRGRQAYKAINDLFSSNDRGGTIMTEFFNIPVDVVIHLPRTEEGETARIMASEKNDSELRAWCDEISQRDFDEPFQPEKYPWLDGSRDGMIDFIVGSFLP